MDSDSRTHPVRGHRLLAANLPRLASLHGEPVEFRFQTTSGGKAASR
jgi:hypothetical protein